METLGGWTLLICGFCVLVQLQNFKIVNAGYGSAYGPITCLCADRTVRTLDSSNKVRQYGCSLFDDCLTCTNNEHQPCAACPPNRYGRMCEFECNCGLQPCDDGIHGDGECHCNSDDDFMSGGRCELIERSYIEDQLYENLPPPKISLLPDYILLSWKHLLQPSDPITGYQIEYKVSRAGAPSYTEWTQTATDIQANETYYDYPCSYNGDEVSRYKFRVNYFNRAGTTTGIATGPIKVPGTPDEPSKLTIYAIQGNSISIRWSPPLDLEDEDTDVGQDIIGYVIQYYQELGDETGGIDPWFTYADAKFDDNIISVDDMTNGSLYRFRIAARNRLGIGKWSAEKAAILPSRAIMLECYSKDDGSDYRGTKASTKRMKECQNWTGNDAQKDGLTPEERPGYGLGYHNFCRNPNSRKTAWCYTTDPDVPWDECDIGQPTDSCHRTCIHGQRLSDTGDCVPDDVCLTHKKVPLTDGEVCTCALRGSNGVYITPHSFVGWTRACAHAVGMKEKLLVENVYNMDVDVCYEECIRSSECEAFTYSTNGYNVFANETDRRVCTLFSQMDKAVRIENADTWTKYLSQTIPDDEYTLSWGCWPADDPRNPREQWQDVDLDNNLVIRDSTYKKYTITLNVADIKGATSGLYISLIIIGTSNVTPAINLFVTEGTQSFIVSKRNVGFVTALKITGQIGIEITLTQVEIKMESVVTSFECNWCPDTICAKKGTLGGNEHCNTRLLLPTTTTIFADFAGFTCSSLSFTSTSNEAFFGWCPLTPQLITVGMPDILPSHFILGDSEESEEDADAGAGRGTILSLIDFINANFLNPFPVSSSIQKRQAEENDEFGLDISEDELTWQEAVDSCLRQGKVLVKVLNDDLLNYVSTIKIVNAGLAGTDFWINGYNNGWSTWKTHDNRPLPTTQQWAEGEPNNSGRCLQLRYTNTDSGVGYRFDDTPCSTTKRYICQSQFATRTLNCKYYNDYFANTECVAMLNFDMQYLLTNDFLADKSVVVDEAVLSLNFKGVRQIRYFSLEGISDPWTRASKSNTSIPRSVFIDMIDTNDTADPTLEIVSEPLRLYIEETLNGKPLAGRYGIMIRAIQEYQQAGFDALIMYKGSSLRPKITMSLQLYKWLVGPWSTCRPNDCIDGIQTRSVSCIHAVSNLPSHDKYCRRRFNDRPHDQQSCRYRYNASCYTWNFRPKPGSECIGANGCGLGQLDTNTVCQNILSEETVPGFYCSKTKPNTDEGPLFRCSEFTLCNFQWVEAEGWTECSDQCGDGYRTREIHCQSSNGSYVSDSLCSSEDKPIDKGKCQEYSDCTVWESLQLLRQDQIYSDRTLIQTQINLTVPAVQAESSLMDAKGNIVETQMKLRLQSVRANMSIPEEVAKAEKLEAQARQAVAKQRIEIPAEEATSFPNVGYLGRGYDIFYGNPRNDDGSIDPGFRQAVIGLTYNKVKYSPDRIYLVPDQADLVREMGSYFGATTSVITSERSYRNSLSVDASVGASASFGSVSGSFSASASYKSMNQATMNSHSVFVDVIGRVIVYDARLVPFNMDVSEEFRQAVKNLPPLRCCIYGINCDEDCSMYNEFITAFGTHYTTNVLMGGRAVQRYQMTSESMEQIQEREVGAGFSASGGVSGIASFSASMSMKMSNSMRNSLSTSETSSTEFFLGGEAGLGDISEGNTDSMKEWASTVFDNPVPIQYKLGAVIDLLNKENFPEDKKIGIKEEILRARYLGYCDRIPDARCSDFSKRDGSEDSSNSVHFGDAVHITIRTDSGRQMMLREEKHYDKKYVYATDEGHTDDSPNIKITIIPLPSKVCTWVQKKRSGPYNPFGEAWVAFMEGANALLSAKSVTYTGLSQDDCEDHCKRMHRMKCYAGTYTAKYNGFCLLFTSMEHKSIQLYNTQYILFWKRTRAFDYTYHWSCYTALDAERFGNTWDEFKLHSFRTRSRFVNMSASGVVTRDEANEHYYIDGNSDEGPYDQKYMRFRFVNDHKPNGMAVKYGDDIMLQEAGIDRTSEKLLMQKLPYYLTVPSPDEANVKVYNRVYNTQNGNGYIWNLEGADINGIVPQVAPIRHSAVERSDFQVQEDGMSVIVQVEFTTPVRRKDSVPGTVSDKIPSVGTSPGYDGHDIISKDFVTTLIRGSSRVMKPLRQRFVRNGREIKAYQLHITFSEQLDDGYILHVQLSNQIVSREGEQLVGSTVLQHHIFLEPRFSVSVLDATSLLRGVDNVQGHFTLRVSFNKPVINAERELPDIYDFEIADINKQIVVNVILSVSPVNTGRSCPQDVACHTDFNVVVASSFLKGERQIYFDVESGRLKSAKDFLFVNGKLTLLDLNIAEPALRFK
ncbi:uncharacterized protein LOC144446518 isoform X2 [Glandiceps talaboti]